MQRKRPRRLQRVPEAFVRCSAHDVPLLFLVYNVSQFTICFLLLCFFYVSSCGNWQMWEPVDITRGLVLLFHRPRSSVCYSEFSLRMHLCVTLFSQVSLVYLIFAVPQTQEQIVEGANFVFFFFDCAGDRNE